MSRVPSLAEARRRAEATRRAKPDIEAASGPATIRALREAIGTGKIPGTYVSSGRVVADREGLRHPRRGRGRRGLAAAGHGQRGPRSGAGRAARRAHLHLPAPQPEDRGRQHRDLRGGGHPAGQRPGRRAGLRRSGRSCGPCSASSARRSCAPTAACCSSPAMTRRRACTWPARCRSTRCPRTRTAARCRRPATSC